MAFWVPARTETMNMMFYSCNGFSLGMNPDTFCGPDPMWRDVLKGMIVLVWVKFQLLMSSIAHRSKPFHVMIGGGDQGKNLVHTLRI